MRLSIIIPARNEERYLPACLDSVAAARQRYARDVQTVVVINRCTDATEQIAGEFGATIVHEDARNLAAIRNAGARAASGEILCTLDADSRMHADAFVAIDKYLSTGRCVGGGVLILPERWSLGIALTGLVLGVWLTAIRASAGMFWCWRRDFDAIRGFDETRSSAEDLDFAARLRRHGKQTYRRYRTLWRTPITTSCRKFDQFGDWYLLTHPRTTWRLLRGIGEREADSFYYDVER